MRLGKKKEKDRELEKENTVEGVARLICSPNPKQSHPNPLRGNSIFIIASQQYQINFSITFRNIFLCHLQST